MAAIEIITKQDLLEFKNDLIRDLKAVLNPTQQAAKQWVKSNEVRMLLSISPGTLQNLRINGTLSFTKVGGMMYYKLEDIQKVLEGGKQ
ncbi:helix-turn-helix domain-containing protein [Mucilaginibacter sp.]|uniref:helix-turn-helix domain-containing protein n=1 Tax=Mucilaginibacter sp. TaxID=1882438 RepID=UPI003B00079B